MLDRQETKRYTSLFHNLKKGSQHWCYSINNGHIMEQWFIILKCFLVPQTSYLWIDLCHPLRFGPVFIQARLPSATLLSLRGFTHSTSCLASPTITWEKHLHRHSSEWDFCGKAAANMFLDLFTLRDNVYFYSSLPFCGDGRPYWGAAGALWSSGMKQWCAVGIWRLPGIHLGQFIWP